MAVGFRPPAAGHLPSAVFSLAQDRPPGRRGAVCRRRADRVDSGAVVAGDLADPGFDVHVPPDRLPLRYAAGKGFLRSPRQLLLYRSEEHTSELQSLMRISYAVFCLKKKHTT